LGIEVRTLTALAEGAVLEASWQQHSSLEIFSCSPLACGDLGHSEAFSKCHLVLVLQAAVVASCCCSLQQVAAASSFKKE